MILIYGRPLGYSRVGILYCFALPSLHLQPAVRYHYALEYRTILTPLIRLLVYGWYTWLNLIGLNYCASTTRTTQYLSIDPTPVYNGIIWKHSKLVSKSLCLTNAKS